MFNGPNEPLCNLYVVLRLILMLEMEIRAAANLHRDSFALSQHLSSAGFSVFQLLVR